MDRPVISTGRYPSSVPMFSKPRITPGGNEIVSRSRDRLMLVVVAVVDAEAAFQQMKVSVVERRMCTRLLAGPTWSRENLDVFDFELSREERARIDALPQDRRLLKGHWAPEWD
jgi:hypothetical protein